jgi:hypothetical protein
MDRFEGIVDRIGSGRSGKPVPAKLRLFLDFPVPRLRERFAVPKGCLCFKQLGTKSSSVPQL